VTEERDLARDELVQLRQVPAAPTTLPALTWHGLIAHAIALLCAMPEDSGSEAMNQWANAVAVSVEFPKPLRNPAPR
jgi:hypothetical protein